MLNDNLLIPKGNIVTTLSMGNNNNEYKNEELIDLPNPTCLFHHKSTTFVRDDMTIADYNIISINENINEVNDINKTVSNEWSYPMCEKCQQYEFQNEE